MKKVSRLINRFTFGYFTKNHLLFFKNYFHFWWTLFLYKKMSPKEKINFFDLQPCINDLMPVSGVDFYYFYQDMWGARKVFEKKPKYHVDIGSSTWLVGILSQFTPVCSIDVRPLEVSLSGLENKKGDIRNIPFENNSLESVSSLCVIEHVGLGRYGDELDPLGTEKAIGEFKRVLKSGGDLYVSVPIGNEEKVCFNANRVFEAKSFVEKFKPLRLTEAKFIQGNRVFEENEFRQLDLNKLVVGLFHFQK